MKWGNQPVAQKAHPHLSRLRQWIRWLLYLYPRAWRDRYGDEVSSLLADHHVTYWTAVDIVLGALDAHLHGDLLPRRLISMAHRIRSSEITIFCAFMLFCIAWLPLNLMHNQMPLWRTAAAAHVGVLIALIVLAFASFVALAAILVGGIPLLFSAIAQSITSRRWRLLALFGIPLLAAMILVSVKFADIQWSSVSQSGILTMQQPIAIQISLILLPFILIGGSVAAIATIIGQSELSLDMFRFALLPAGVATGALAFGLIGAIALTAFFIAEVPQARMQLPLQTGGLILMLASVVLATIAMRRGISAVQREL